MKMKVVYEDSQVSITKGSFPTETFFHFLMISLGYGKPLDTEDWMGIVLDTKDIPRFLADLMFYAPGLSLKTSEIQEYHDFLAELTGVVGNIHSVLYV